MDELEKDNISEFNYYVKADAKSFLQNGNDFMEAAWRCTGIHESGESHVFDGKSPTLVPAATAVNAACAMEMYLKALILKNGEGYPKGKNGHNLKVLFECLPEGIKSEIDKLVGYTEEGNSLFEQFVNKHANDFVDIRYYVERSGWQGIDPFSLITYAQNLKLATQIIFGRKYSEISDEKEI